MYNKPSFSSFVEPVIGPEFHEKVKISDIVLDAISACNTAAREGDEIKYSNSVKSLLNNLPRENRERLESDKYKELYISKVETFEYKFFGKHKIGTPENPVYTNTKDRWNYSKDINGGKPVLVSPIAVEVEQTDFEKLFTLIMSELEDLHITYQVESKGNVEKRIDAKPTPEFSKPQTVPYLEQVELEDEDEDLEDDEEDTG